MSLERLVRPEPRFNRGVDRDAFGFSSGERLNSWGYRHIRRRSQFMLKQAVLFVSMMSAGAAMAAAPFDDMFVRTEAQRSLYELAISRMGQSRASSPEVRAYAATVVNDQEAFDAALRELAAAKGIPVPSSVAANDQKRVDRLAASDGTSFDSAFIREAQRINSDEVRSLRREASRAVDPDIRNFVTRFLEVDEKHEAQAKALGQRKVTSRMPVLPPPRTGSAMPVISPPSSSAMPVIQPK
jgi:putative membrane protein